MNTTPIGDLAKILQSQSRVASAQNELARLTAELSSGRKASLGKSLNGNFVELASIERSLKITGTYQVSAESAANYFSSVQDLLAAMEDGSGRLGVDILAAAKLGEPLGIKKAVVSAEDRLSSAVSALNQQIAGRNAFSGAATDQPALIPSEEILINLEAALVGVTDATTMVQIVDDWFQMAGGGYETVAYLGSVQTSSGFIIAEGDAVEPGITALETGFRTNLSGLALSALIAREVGPTDSEALASLAEAAGSRIIDGNSEIISIRSDIGVVEARIDETLTQHLSTASALSLRQSELTSADPFQTATRLQAVESQLESLFLITARLSRLSLAEYL